MTHPFSDIPGEPERPPAAVIPGALASTEAALGAMTDDRRFEDVVTACLAIFDPTLRPTGGSGDEQRDATGGPLFAEDGTAVAASTESRWRPKARRDLEGLTTHHPRPVRAIVATSRRAGSGARKELEREAPGTYGFPVRVVDQRFLASCLLRREMLALREEMLGLAPPEPPVAMEADVYERSLAASGSNVDQLYGRDTEVARLRTLLQQPGAAALEGPGGVGKTAIALASARELETMAGTRVLFIDDRVQINRRVLPAELTGADHLILIVDNAHRRDDLRELVGMLRGRTGPTNIVLVARAGFRERLTDAVEGSTFGPLLADRIMDVAPLANGVIADIVRNAQPALAYQGAVEHIVAIAEGIPLIALMAHRAVSNGAPLESLGAGDVLASHSQSLIQSILDRAGSTAEHQVRELLAVMATLTAISLDEDAELDRIADLLGINRWDIRRLLHDFADAGLVTQRGERFAITPELLSGHVLFSSFFADDPQVSLRYEDVFDAFAVMAAPRLCEALGGLPRGAVEEGNRAAQSVVAKVRAHVVGGEPELVRSLAPGLPWVAAALVDDVLQHLPADVEDRARSLSVGLDALGRTPDIDKGWPRQLAVATAVFGIEHDSDGIEGAHDKATKALTDVYSRVPVNQGPGEGAVLWHVQRVLAEQTASYWRRHADEAGVSEAVAVASRQLLTVIFEQHFSSSIDDRTIHLRGCTLPASEQTARTLEAGAELFIATLPRLSCRRQIDQVKWLNELTRAAGGFSGPFGVQPSDELAALASRAQEQIVAGLAPLGGDLPIVVRAGLEEELGPIWPGDAELAEFHQLLSVYGPEGDPRCDAWDVAVRDERAKTLADRLIDDEDSQAVIDRWSNWIAEIRHCDDRHHSDNVVVQALEVATRSDPGRMAPLIDRMLAASSPLGPYLRPALSATLTDQHDGHARAQAALQSEDPVVRALAAGAVGDSSLAARFDLLSAAAEDEDRSVRGAVLQALRFGGSFGHDELSLALRAAQPDDVHGVTLLIWSLRRGEEFPEFSAEQMEAVRQLVLAAARQDRLRGYDLRIVFDHFAASMPRLPIEFCRARIERQQSAEPERDFRAFMRVDSLPREIRSAVTASASTEDVEWVLDQIEAEDGSSRAHGTLRDLLEWIDGGREEVTERLAKWFAGDTDRLVYEARRVLDHTLAPDVFRERARQLLAAGSSARVEDAIIGGRHPRGWSGTLHRFWRARRDEFQAWTDDDDPAVADVGRGAVDYYTRRLKQEPEEDPGDDLDPADDD